MPPRQVSEVLDSIRNVHRQLAKRYREIERFATDERIKLLLEDMRRREDRFAACVAGYNGNKHSKVLDTWLQFVPEEVEQLDEIDEQLKVPSSLSELVEATLKLNGSLVRAYLALAKDAPTAELQELFADLASMEEHNDSHYVKALLDE